jgi:hypothetical protein
LLGRTSPELTIELATAQFSEPAPEFDFSGASSSLVLAP